MRFLDKLRKNGPSLILSLFLCSLFLFSVSGFGLTDPSIAITTFTSKFLSWQTGATGIGITLLEVLFRFVPSQKPLSWAWIAANTIGAVGNFMTAVANWLDKMLPQNVAPVASSGTNPPTTPS